METNNLMFERRWNKLEAAKSHTRKIALTLVGIALTSLVLAITATGA